MSDNEDDGGLVLNLQTTGSYASRRRAGKVSKNRKKRIQKRRKLKNQNFQKEQEARQQQNDETTMEASSVTTAAAAQEKQTTQVAQMQNTTATKPSQQKKAGKKQKTPIQKTSIWGGNPLIPSIESTIKSSNDDDDDVTSNDVSSDVKATRFSQLTSIDANLRSYVTDKMGFDEMTPVQCQSFPHLLARSDVLIRSPTGSGKTLAYSLALIQMLKAQKPEITRQTGVFALVLVPTRELALQTLQVFERICLPVRRLVPTCLMGGQKRQKEKARLRKGVNVIISTPGRLLDHIENTECLNFSQVNCIVFDEADRLLDLGFQPSIEKVLKKIRESRVADADKLQTILLSATLTKGVENLIDLSLCEPIRVEVDSRENEKITTLDPKTNLVIDKASFPTKLQQFIAVVPSKLRLVSLISLIHLRCLVESPQKLVIFLSCRDSVEFHRQLFSDVVAPLMEWKDVAILSLHGGMEQVERSRTMSKIKVSESCILLCTDVGARGLDIPEIDWVIQYTSPGNPVDYIHRVGRTARAGKQGNALLFVTPAETEYVKILSSQFEIKVRELKCDELMNGLVKIKNQKNAALQNQLSQEKAAEIHNKMEEQIKSNKSLKELSIKAFTSFIKSYATYPTSLKYIFHIRNLHLGHVAKSFALQEAPSMMLESLKKCLGDGHVRSLKRKMEMTKRREDKVGTSKHVADKKILSDRKKLSASEGKEDQSKSGASKRPNTNLYDPLSEFSSGVDWKATTKKRKVDD